jgi:hypothetical protein
MGALIGYITVQGHTLTISQAARQVGLRPLTVRFRLENGWCVECSLNVAMRAGCRHKKALLAEASE